MVLHICEFDGCLATFNKPSRLKIHSMLHTGEKPHACLVRDCSKAYRTASHLKRHEETSHSTTCIVLKCENCNKKFDYVSQLKSHLKNFKVDGFCGSKPNADVITEVLEQPTNVELSDVTEIEKLEGKKSDIVEKTCIEQSNDGEIEKTLFLCTEDGCSKSFISNYSLKVHLKKYHGLRKFKCTHCQKTFRKNQQLKIHEYEHTKVKPFGCDKCEKRFLLPSKLKAHQKVHIGYTCPQVNCGITLETWTQLRKHKKVAHPTEYGCDICDKTFFSKSTLRAHIAIHSTDRLAFHCPHNNCVRYYFCKKNLESHIKAVHLKCKFRCQHEGCTKSYRKKKSLSDHEEVHKPNYVPALKKPRRKRKPDPVKHKLLGVSKDMDVEELTKTASKVLVHSEDGNIIAMEEESHSDTDYRDNLKNNDDLTNIFEVCNQSIETL